MEPQNSEVDNVDKQNMQKKILYIRVTLLYTCIILLQNSAYSQDKRSGEIGIFAGGSYYLGDINKTPFVGTQPSFGAFFRHSFDTRFAATGSINYGKLKGNTENSVYNIPEFIEFNKPFYELEANGEFNFMRFFSGKVKKYPFTPYLSAGIGLTYYPQGSSNFIFNIPFGVGVKYNLNSYFILSSYIGMRKTFVDNIDYDYSQPSQNRDFKQYGYVGNKDWYSVFGVSLSYKIKYRMKCPAFN